MPTPQYSSFTEDTTTGNYPLLVQFTDTSGTNTPTSWSWDFGDGSALNTTQNPSHVFTAAGSYSVVLTTVYISTYVSSPTIITITTPPPPSPPPPVFIGTKIKIQGEQISYSTSDPTTSLDFNVTGTMNVRDSISIGDMLTLEDAIISTPDGTSSNSANLQVTTGAYGIVKIQQNPTAGSILLNNVQWPSGVITPNPGMYVGASVTNVLEYYSFILGFNGNNALTMLDLNNAYPNAQPGQSVLSTNVIYYCVGLNDWRMINVMTPLSGV